MAIVCWRDDALMRTRAVFSLLPHLPLLFIQLLLKRIIPCRCLYKYDSTDLNTSIDRSLQRFLILPPSSITRNPFDVVNSGRL